MLLLLLLLLIGRSKAIHELHENKNIRWERVNEGCDERMIRQVKSKRRVNKFIAQFGGFVSRGRGKEMYLNSMVLRIWED